MGCRKSAKDADDAMGCRKSVGGRRRRHELQEVGGGRHGLQEVGGGRRQRHELQEVGRRSELCHPFARPSIRVSENKIMRY